MNDTYTYLMTNHLISNERKKEDKNNYKESILRMKGTNWMIISISS